MTDYNGLSKSDGIDATEDVGYSMSTDGTEREMPDQPAMSRLEIEERRSENQRQNREFLQSPYCLILLFSIAIVLICWLVLSGRLNSVSSCDDIDHFASYHFHVLF